MTKPTDPYQTAAHKAANYLYNIDGELTQEQYKAISTLRQLINEVFKPQEQISNQFIYDHLKEIL